MTDSDRDALYFLLGPWLIGGFLDVLLEGVLLCQIVNYFSWYKDDKRSLRYAVVGLFALTSAKSVQAFALVWKQNIVYFNNLEGAIQLPYDTWYMGYNGLFTAIIGAYVQYYFCWRLYAISGRLWIVVPIAFVLATALVAICLATFFTTRVEQADIGRWYAIHLSTAFAGDFLMASSSAYYLLQRKPENGLKRTDDLVNALVRLTFQSAAPAALCAMLNLIFSRIYSGTDRLISTAFNMALAKIYAVSMMYTLNARRSIRLTHSIGELSSQLEGGTSVRFRTDYSENDLELGRTQAFDAGARPSTAIQIQSVSLRPLDACDCEATPTTESDSKIRNGSDGDDHSSFKNRTL